MQYLTDLWKALDGRLVVLVVLTVLDLVFGVIASLVKKEFKWVYLNHFLLTDVIPIFVWIGVVIMSLIPVEFVPSGVVMLIPYAVYVSVFIGILASILGSIKELGVMSETLGRLGI